MVGMGYGKAKEVPATLPRVSRRRRRASSVSLASRRPFRTRSRARPLPVSSCFDLLLPVLVSSPVVRCVRSSMLLAFRTSCPSRWDQLTQSTSFARRSRLSRASNAQSRLRHAVVCLWTRSPLTHCCGRSSQRREEILMAKLKENQRKSDIGGKPNQRASLCSLGLKRIDDVVVCDDRPELRGTTQRRASPRDCGRGGFDMSNDYSLKVHDLRPAPGAKTPRPVSVVVKLRRARQPDAEPRAHVLVTRFPHGFEGGQTPMHMRLPKLRGFKNPVKVTFQVCQSRQAVVLVPRRR